MGDVVNLRRFRKAKLREDDSRKAEANRALHGRTKAEKTLTRAERALEAARLDAHRLTGDRDDPA